MSKSSAGTCNHGEWSATCPVCTLVIQTAQDEEFKFCTRWDSFRWYIGRLIGWCG